MPVADRVCRQNPGNRKGIDDLAAEHPAARPRPADTSSTVRSASSSCASGRSTSVSPVARIHPHRLVAEAGRGIEVDQHLPGRRLQAGLLLEAPGRRSDAAPRRRRRAVRRATPTAAGRGRGDTGRPSGCWPSSSIATIGHRAVVLDDLAASRSCRRASAPRSARSAKIFPTYSVSDDVVSKTCSATGNRFRLGQRRLCPVVLLGCRWTVARGSPADSRSLAL